MRALAALCGAGGRGAGLRLVRALAGGASGAGPATGADGAKPARRKTAEPARITLIAPDEALSITELSSAQSLALRRDLKLVKIQDADTKTRRPVYRLMTNAQYHEEELQSRKENQAAKQNANKAEKVLTMSSKIGQHDLMTRVKNITKWLEKQHEVRVIIEAHGVDKTQDAENIYNKMESNVKGTGKIVQKRTKGNSVRFQIIPIKAKQTNSNQQELQCNQTGGEKSTNGQGPL